MERTSRVCACWDSHSRMDKVCDEVYLKKTGIVMMVVMPNDLTVELLGKSEQLRIGPTLSF